MEKMKSLYSEGKISQAREIESHLISEFIRIGYAERAKEITNKIGEKKLNITIHHYYMN